MKKLQLNKKVIALLDNPNRILGGENKVTFTYANTCPTCYTCYYSCQTCATCGGNTCDEGCNSGAINCAIEQKDPDLAR